MKPTKAERLIQRMKKQAETRTPKVNTPEANAAIPPRQTITLVPVPVLEWTGCYDESWRDLITPESFSHPAKAGRKLLHNIFSHLESIGALTPGRSIVVDPFGGVGTTGIIGAWRGYPVICCELEPKFIELTKANFAKETPKWEVMRLPIPRVVQGDSRKLREHIQTEIDAIVSSPPYTGDINVLDFFGKKSASEQSYNSKYFGPNDVGYGKTGGQLGELETGDVDAIVSSPPYAELGANIKGHGIEGAGVSKDPKYGQAEYGDSPGQLGQMKEAEGVDAIVSSPPYAELGANTKGHGIIGIHATPENPCEQQEYGKSEGQLGQMREGVGVDVIVSSPPYAEIATGAGGLNTKPPQHEGQQGGRSADAPSQETDQKYGSSEGQMARMEKGEVDVVISSPPFQQSLTNDPKNFTPYTGPGKYQYSPDVAERRKQDYGHSEGQLGAMETGGVDAVISSPPYADQPINPGETSRPEAKIARLIAEGKYEDAEKVRRNCSGNASNLRQQDYGSSEGQLGAMEPGGVDVVISSPPYVETTLERAGPPSKMMDALKTPGTSTKSDKLEGYGHADGQLGSMDAGGVDAVISSPPYSETILNDDQRQAGKGEKLRWGTNEEYGISPGQLGILKEKDGVDAIVSSPPYADGGVHGSSNEIDHDEQERAKRAFGNPLGTSSVTGYGTSEGQLSAKEPGAVDAVVSSPPFGSGDSASAQSITERTDKSAEWVKANCGPAATQGYGTSPGQMAQMPVEQETFWTAARDIVRECYAILKPGGYAVWIVKAFVRDKAIVDFPNDWRKLCEYCGFETITEVHAMLVKQQEYKNLWNEQVVDKKERKSFFRRLAESKGSPRIDYEVVLFTRKR